MAKFNQDKFNNLISRQKSIVSVMELVNNNPNLTSEKSSSLWNELDLLYRIYNKEANEMIK